jgi:hypothetical protein
MNSSEILSACLSEDEVELTEGINWNQLEYGMQLLLSATIIKNKPAWLPVEFVDDAVRWHSSMQQHTTNSCDPLDSSNEAEIAMRNLLTNAVQNAVDHERMAKEICNELQIVIISSLATFPGIDFCSLQLYGSTTNHLSMSESSDVDTSLHITILKSLNEDTVIKEVFEMLNNILPTSTLFTVVELVSRARTPVLKLKHVSTGKEV